MMHSCPDGTHTRLVRSGPVGTMRGVRFDCPRCGWSRAGATIWTNAKRILNDPAVRAALR
jgi:predicted RNA-binding Zn-ribbon protein involved in translation (DUF1610 family)